MKHELGTLLKYEQPTKYIVQSEQYQDNYTLPVLTAGQSFVLGYTNESNGIYTNLPCIIFDDFTTSSHYVDFPFKVKSSAMKMLTAGDGVDIKYMYYYLQSIRFSAVEHKRYWISKFSKFVVDLPSIQIQNSIVARIDGIARLINIKNKQMKELDSLIKSRFVEMFGNQKTNSKAWKQDKLSNLLSIERGGSPRPIDTYITESEDGVNWIKISDAEQGSIYITKAKQKILKTGIKKSRHVKSGDFLLSNSMSFGRPYILKIDGYIHDGWLVLRDINGLFNKLYLYSALSSDYSYSQFCNAAAGAVVNNLNKDIVGKLVIAIPPKEVQNQFAEFVNQVNKSKFAIQKALEKDQMLYDSLMQQYFG